MRLPSTKVDFYLFETVYSFRERKTNQHLFTVVQKSWAILLYRLECYFHLTLVSNPCSLSIFW